MSELRVVHYVNQFFAGVGGESKAYTPPGKKEGAVGPATLLQGLLGDQGRVAATVFCGDNHVVEQPTAIEKIVSLIGEEKPHIVFAGPAFGAGRYGLACGQVGAAVQCRLGIPAVTGMHAQNPAADMYRSKVYIASTAETAAGMREALQTMLRLARKLHTSEPLGSPKQEGYLPTGRRVHFFAKKNAAERAVEMLLHKVREESYETEWEVPVHERVPPAPPVKDLSRAKLVLVTTGGVVPRGNPDHLQAAYATRWLKYSIKNTEDLEPDRWESIHGGYDTTHVNGDPDRMAPVDALRALEKEGAFGRLVDYLYTTTGNTSAVPTMRRFAQEMVQEFKAENIDGIVLTSA